MTNEINNIDLIQMIKSLDNKSTKEDINTVINYDLKQLSPNLKVGEEQHSIKRFLKYKATTKGNFEPDATVSAMNFLKHVLALQLSINEDEISVDDKRGLSFAVDGKRVWLESDTMNSFWTTYKSAITNLLPDYKQSCKIADINTSKAMVKQMHKLIEGYIVFDLNESNSELDKELQLFATLTHSVMNMVLVPRNFNRARLAKTNDFWDLSLMLLNAEDFSNKDSNYTWYLNNLDKMMIEDCFNGPVNIDNVKVLFDNHGFASENMLPKTLEEITQCVSSINTQIQLRGLRLISLINPKCEAVCNEMIEELTK